MKVAEPDLYATNHNSNNNHRKKHNKSNSNTDTHNVGDNNSNNDNNNYVNNTTNSNRFSSPQPVNWQHKLLQNGLGLMRRGVATARRARARARASAPLRGSSINGGQVFILGFCSPAPIPVVSALAVASTCHALLRAAS